MVGFSTFIKSLRTSPTFWIVVANAAIYFTLIFLFPAAELEDIYIYYGLSTVGLGEGRFWQIFTYAWLHANFWHLLVNMLCLWFTGRAVEHILRGRWFCLLYFLGILGGALLQMLFAGPEVTLMGASGAVCAVMLGFSTIYCDRKILLLLFFILPLPLQARFLGWIIILTSVVSIIYGVDPHIGHAAHLGGALTGYFFTRALGFGRRTLLEKFIGLFQRKTKTE